VQHEPFCVARIFDLLSASYGLYEEGHAHALALTRKHAHALYFFLLKLGVAAADREKRDDRVRSRRKSFFGMSYETGLESPCFCFRGFVESGCPIKPCDQAGWRIGTFSFREVSKVAKIEQDGICARVDETLDLTSRIKSSRYRAQDQGVIEGNHQGAAVLPEHASQANGFPEIGQDFSPVKRYNTRVM
jgi:hypothetical protein